MNARADATDVSTDAAVLAQYQCDAGGVYAARPAAVARPRTVDSLAQCFADARANGLRVAFRGGGESYSGHALCADGMVVDMTALAPAHPVEIGDGWVRAAGGHRLGELREHLRRRGLRVGVDTPAPRATVGGTVSAGGLSGRSYSRGMLAHHVLALELMGTDGRVWHCDSARNRDIFHAALANMGQAGALLSVTLATEPLRPHRARLAVAMPSAAFDEFRAALAAHGGVDSLEARIARGRDHGLTLHAHCAMEASSADEVAAKADAWEDVLRRLCLSTMAGLGGAFAAHQVQVGNVDDPIAYTMSANGWRETPDYRAFLARASRRGGVRCIPLGVLYDAPDALAAMHALRPYMTALANDNDNANANADANSNAALPPYLMMVNAMRDHPNPWLRLSDAHDQVVALQVPAVFAHSDRRAAMARFAEAARVAADLGGRLYPQAAVPDAELMARLLPTPSEAMRRAIAKTDPDGLIVPAWSRCRAL
ncbi:MAG: FAD-binding oxidoreductase [bacterium]